MLGYYFGLAARRLRRTPWLTLLMILSLAVGIAAGMTTITLRYVLGLDPVPGKGERLASLQAPSAPSPTDSMFTYADAMALARMGGSGVDAVISGEGITTALSAAGRSETISQGVGIRYASSGFFRMFGVPVERGRTWTREEEESAAPVAVVEESMATHLFHGADPIGKQLRVGDTQYTVIGVTGYWNPRPRYYDLDGVAGPFGGGGDAIFLPVTAVRYAPDSLMVTRACFGLQSTLSSPPELLSAPCRWLGVWYLARSRKDAHALARALESALPRMLPADRAEQLRLRSVRQMLADADVVPAPVRLYAVLGVAFLMLCVLNASGMQLSRVLRTGALIGIQRALGASRAEIVRQYLCDALLVGSLGGALGMGLTCAALSAVRRLPDVYYADMARMDGAMFALMVVLVFACSVLVGVVPAWLAGRTDPAALIKAPP